MLFGVAAAVLTSLGRLNLGLAQATSSRYQAVALVFWACLAGLILASIPKAQPRRFALIGVQIGLLILMIATAGRFAGMNSAAQQHQASLAIAYSALAYDPPDIEALKPLYPAPAMVPRWYAYLRAHKLGPDPQELANTMLHPSEPLPNWAGYHVVANTNCSGYLDATQRVAFNRVVAQGWAWDSAAKHPPRKIVLALPGGWIVGSGQVDTLRPDVTAALKIPDPRTGWHGEAIAPSGSRLTAFAVLADSKSICPLSNELNVP
ncbi:MAG: hypothetical protein JOZ32_11335 [Bryobacterales bacterium]|nr:hypothetical protein [Bryobacterales bacterium]